MCIAGPTSEIACLHLETMSVKIDTSIPSQ
jgi:hypothetical protein